jgi:hypothetical protein
MAADVTLHPQADDAELPAECWPRAALEHRSDDTAAGQSRPASTSLSVVSVARSLTPDPPLGATVSVCRDAVRAAPSRVICAPLCATDVAACSQQVADVSDLNARPQRPVLADPAAAFRAAVARRIVMLGGAD